MSKGRMEAFSDGVIAIIITVRVLELKTPHETTTAALRPLIPVFLSYVLSYVFLGIYWSNHHHLLHAISHVDGRTLWANLHLLFWLSLIPFVTAWMGENQFAAWPVALYGVVMFFAAIAYFILTRALIALHGRESVLATAVGAGPQGQGLGRDLRRRRPPGLREFLDFLRPVRPGRHHVADPRPPDRENAARVMCMRLFDRACAGSIMDCC